MCSKGEGSRQLAMGSWWRRWRRWRSLVVGGGGGGRWRVEWLACGGGGWLLWHLAAASRRWSISDVVANERIDDGGERFFGGAETPLGKERKAFLGCMA